ncbi:MAG: LPS export ABC transporter periplasmic protein LptC [Gammaproteobacteria bacterium]|nr:LPS export ABC transporter periplasmic protein LptC [Gammaproteobacteria bacterium]
MIARWAPALLMLLLAVASGWLMQRLTEVPEPDDPALRHDPDLFLNDFVRVGMDADGVPAEELRAKRMVHYPDTDTHELEEPHVLVHGDDDTPTQVRSERGWVSADQSVIILQGRVYIWEDDHEGRRRLEVLTSNLTIYNDEDYAETGDTALIRTPSGESRSVGLKAWMAGNRLELISQVQTTYDPKKTD